MEWFRDRTSGLDLEAPLDDLEPLRDIVGDARVVALGEGAHFVREFTQARQRLLRFLVERCGFTVLAFEFGFVEGFALDAWLRGEDVTLTGTTNSGVTPELVRWLRRYEHPVRFVGLDTPMAGGSLRPALEPVADYLREVDPEAVPQVELAMGIADRVTGASVAEAAPQWDALPTADQDALTAALARLQLRFRALGALYVPRGGRQPYQLARHQLEAAAHADHMFGVLRDLFAGGGRSGEASVREHFMAESMRWHLDRLEPDSRVVLAAHNQHVQKVPVSYDGALAALPLGLYLDRVFGDGYRAVALTQTAGRVPEMHPDATVPGGFRVVEESLAAPGAGSVEAALVEAGHGEALTLTDLRGAPDTLDRIRSQSAEIAVPVAAAYDAVVSCPTVTTEQPVLGLGGV